MTKEANMSYQEKRALLTIFGNILIMVFYSLYIYKHNQEQILNNPNDFKFWGKTFLVLIPISIAAFIILHIIFIIINKIVTNEDAVSITDEFDKIIELKATRISHWVFILGFFLAMGSQVIEMQPWVMFIVLVSSGFFASIFSEISKIYYYRKGV